MSAEKLALIGFMGTGKTTVGLAAATELGVSFTDTDDRMRERSKTPLAERIKADMAEFRRFEAAIVREILTEQEAGVIATGGGVICTELGRTVLKTADVPVVWLQAPYEVAVERMLEDPKPERPLFNAGNVNQGRILFDERWDWYHETATHIIDASQPLDLVVGQVVEIACSQI